MKTTREWFNELPEDIRDKAISNSEKSGDDTLDTYDPSMSMAISGAFLWGPTPEGYSYWKALSDEYNTQK